VKKGDGSNSIIPVLGLYFFSVFKIVPSVIKFTNLLQDMKFILPSISPYTSNKHPIDAEILENQKNTEEKNTNFEFKKKIEINNLKYEYASNKKKIFDDLSIRINKNQLIGIHGESGSGKTTLINLLLGLLRPDNGAIVVDEKDILNDINGWQRKISYIPQNIFIIDEKILNNVALGIPVNEININKVNECLKFANLSKFIDELPEGINTNCGELGDKISGGQKQRLAIARAFYNNAEVLIFDEFTNNLDKENEKKIMEEIFKLKDKTRIIVSHSTKVLSYCEKIFEIKKINNIK
jgi:ABC-type multidrug transport system fused ATPase/permease subunit